MRGDFLRPSPAAGRDGFRFLAQKATAQPRRLIACFAALIVRPAAGDAGRGAGDHGLRAAQWRQWRPMGHRGRQAFKDTGTNVNAEFLVNTTTAGDQSQPAAAAFASGNFVAVWTSANQDGSGTGIYARRFMVPGVK